MMRERPATTTHWKADFTCKVCGWQWIATGQSPDGLIQQFEHTCTGPTVSRQYASLGKGVTRPR